MFLIFLLTFLLSPIPASADSGHIVISEIQAYGQTATDEFIRLWNPTDTAVDISGWRLAKKTSSGAESPLISSFADSTIIAPNSGFLIAHSDYYLGSEIPDIFYPKSYSFAANNTIILKDAIGAVIDKAGFGTAQDFEGAPADNPENGKSIKRKDWNDTDNNKNDFSALASGDSAPPPANPPATAQAEYGDIVISEVMPDPAEGKEWIEFWNAAENDIDVSGWKVKDASNEIYALSGAIAAQSFLTIEINNRLNNGGDTIYLSDKNSFSINMMSYGPDKDAPAPEEGQSIARLPDGKYAITDTPTKNFANQFSKTATDAAEPETENAPPADYSKIYIAEILPNPAGGDTAEEYIKIRNDGDEIDLGGLYLDDADGGSNPYKIPAGTIIAAGGDLTFRREKTKLALNNDEDEARILARNKEEFAAVSYESAKEGAIYKLENGKWNWSSPVIARSANDEAIPTDTGLPRSARNDNFLTAIVIAPPGLLGSQIMYIDGRQLYMYSKDWPELAIGDKISVYGEPSTYYGEPRLKLKNRGSIKIISRGNAAEPPAITGEELDDENIGRLVSIEGEVIESGAQKFYIDAGGAELTVYNKAKAELPAISEKDTIKITGILSKYKDELRLLPRGADDIQIIKTADAETITVDNARPFWQYAISITAIGIAGGAMYLRRRKNGNARTAQPLG